MRIPNKSLNRFGFRQPQVRGFNGIIPYEIPGMPSGVLEMGLGALLGYMVGNTQGRGAVGALFGLAAGAVLGQVQPKGGSPATGEAKGYIVTKQPGTTPAGATPDKAGSGFDWNAAGSIVQNLLLDSKRISDVKNIMDLVSKSWGSSTAKDAGYSTGPMAAEGYLPWKDEGFYTDPCANGCVLVESSDLQAASIPDETYTGPMSSTPNDEPWY